MKYCQKAFERALKRDSDPRLKALMKVTSGEANFIEKQKSRLQDADVVGVTCASANSAILTGIQSHVLILDEVSQMTEALSLLPIAAARPMKILLILFLLQHRIIIDLKYSILTKMSDYYT